MEKEGIKTVVVIVCVVQGERRTNGEIDREWVDSIEICE